MINDPTIRVECDKCYCLITVEPEYKYTDYSGESGFYDCSDTAILETIEMDGWVKIGDEIFCDECKPGDSNEI